MRAVVYACVTVCVYFVTFPFTKILLEENSVVAFQIEN